VASAVTLAVLAGTAPTFLDPFWPALLALLAGHVLAGGVIAGLGGLLVPALRHERGGALVVLALYGSGLALACALHASVTPSFLALVAALNAGAFAGLVLAASVPPRWLAVPAAAGVVVVTLLLLAGRHAPPVPARLLVVGLDGGTWSVIDPMIAAGELPVLASMRDDGTSGVLRSLEPSFSSTLWTSIATGRLPEEHGVRDFYASQDSDLRATRFWEVASARGERVGIFRGLVTWPPDPLAGFVVPGWLARDARTHPTEHGYLKDLELRFQEDRRIGAAAAGHFALRSLTGGLRFASLARIGADGAQAWWFGEEPARYRAGKLAQLALEGDVFLALYRAHRPAVATAVVYASDALSHHFWKYHEPAAYPDGVDAAAVARYGDTVREVYRRFDDFLGRVLAATSRDTTVLVVSDHGFRAAADRQLALRTDALLEFLDAGERFSAHAINRKVYLTHRHAGTSAAADDVERVIRGVTAARAGNQPLAVVERLGDDRLGLELTEAVAALPGETAVVRDDRRATLSSLVARTTWSGSHDDAGIFLATGPGVRRGQRRDASILDVAPTALAILGYAVADDMDGRVLDELFAEPPLRLANVESYDALRPRRATVAGPDDGLAARLRALGYVR